MFDLVGKVAVVTGGASGIGRATAQRFAAAGATVVIADIADAVGLAAELGGQFHRVDVSVEAQVEQLMASAAEVGGRIDICVNNVGIGVGGAIADARTADFVRTFEVNVLGTVYGMKHAAGYMRSGGAIVNTASIAGVLGYPTYGSYGASKFAVVGLTKIAALEYGAMGIRVNCVCPSSVNTPQLAAQQNAASEVATLGAAAAIRRLVEPEDVAAAIHFLASDDCPVLTGQAIMLDGGATAGISPTIIELATASVVGGLRGH